MFTLVGCKRILPQDNGQDKRIRLDPDVEFAEAFHNFDYRATENSLLRGASPNIILSDDSTPLHMAVRVGNIPMVRLLLDFGANVDALNPAGQTPLHLALWRQLNPYSKRAHDATIVATIIERSPNPHVSDSLGWTPLHLAAMVADIPTTAWLFAQSVNVDNTNFRGQTPLHVATRNWRQEGLDTSRKFIYERIIAGLLLANSSEVAKDGFKYTYEDYKQKDVSHIPTYSEEWYAVAIVVGINRLASI